MTTFPDLKITTSTAPSYQAYKLTGDEFLITTRRNGVETVEGRYLTEQADAKLDELLGNPGHTDCQEWNEGITYVTFTNYDEDSPWAEIGQA